MKSKKFPMLQTEIKDMLWLLQTLASVKCNTLKIPETLLFRQGVPSLFVYTTSHNILKCTPKIKFHEIISLFMRNVYKRISKSCPSPFKASFSKHVAVLRYNNGSLKLLENTELVSILTEKPLNPIWAEINSIQSLVIRENCLENIQKLCFDHNENFSNKNENATVTSIRNSLLSANYKLISAEFELYSDIDGTNWLSNALSLRIQRLNTEVNHKELVPIRMSDETRKVFLQGIDFHSSKPKSKKLMQIQSLMHSHYSSIKHKLMIDEALSSQFHFEVPERALPFMPSEKSKTSHNDTVFLTADPRNTQRTIRRLSLFQSVEFKSMRSPRIKGRRLFE